MKIRATNNTPWVFLDWDVKYLVLEGVSYPEDAESFYSPLISELEENSSKYLSGGGEMGIRIQLDYFNTVSAKAIYRILKIFDKLVDSNNNTRINLVWEIEEDDEELMEAGKDYECMFDKIDFNYKII
tara:strand:+ start:632 stop:1015 length:384 start_codon:yes stop_codon:yes gene_type:complete